MLVNIDKFTASVKEKEVLKLLLFIFKKYAFEALIPNNATNKEVYRVNKLQWYKQYLKVVRNEEYRIILIDRILKEINQLEEGFGIK
jgi:hypothetical protein